MSKHRQLIGQHLTALFIIGFLLLNYPLLHVFSIDRTIFGIPVLYLYVFICWTILIVLMGVIVERRK